MLKNEVNMRIIESISIKNFRSILKLSQPLNPKDINVAIGLNDSGKSNLLKALNLFLMHQLNWVLSSDLRMIFASLLR